MSSCGFRYTFVRIVLLVACFVDVVALLTDAMRTVDGSVPGPVEEVRCHLRVTYDGSKSPVLVVRGWLSSVNPPSSPFFFFAGSISVAAEACNTWVYLSRPCDRGERCL